MQLFKQRDNTDCGSACFAFLCRHYNLSLSLAVVRRHLGTSSTGTSAANIVSTAINLGFTAKGVKGTSDALSSVPLPAIAHCLIDQKRLHYVVLVAWTPKFARIMDPAVGRVEKWSHEKFKSVWTGVLILMAPGQGFQPGDHTISPARRLWRLLQPHKSVLIQAFVGAVLSTILALATAVLSVSAMGSLRSTDGSKAHAQTQKSRLPQAILLTAGVAFFIAGVQTKFALLAIAFIGLGLILAIPNFNKLMPPDIWRAKRGLPAILACRMLATAAFLSIDSFVPLAADRIHGASATIQGFVIIGAALTWSLGSALSTRRSHIPVARSAVTGFALILFGIFAIAPVLSPNWPLLATFLAWCFGGFGMGILFVPTSVAATAYADDGNEGQIGGQLTLADSLGFALMGGIGGATVAVSDRTDWPLSHALGTNFLIAAILAALGIVASRGVAQRT